VVEVGPGRGALTRSLLDHAGRVVGVELDRALCEQLRAELGARPNWTLLEGDFLRVPVEAFPPGPLKFVGNLPYETGGPMLRRIGIGRAGPQAVVMLQKEVAHRLMAEPGSKSYGPLTLETALRAQVEWVVDVPPDCFLPPPKVQPRSCA